MRPAIRVGARLAGVLLAGAVIACSSARRGEPIAGEMTLESSQLQHGALVYAEHCQKCHPGGEAGLGPGLNDKPLPQFLMHLQVRAGLGVMPSFPEAAIDDRELDDLLDYVVALRRHGG